LKENSEADSGQDAAERSLILGRKELENADDEQRNRAKDDNVQEYDDFGQADMLRCLAAKDKTSDCASFHVRGEISVQSMHQHQHDTHQRRESYAVDNGDGFVWGARLVIHELQNRTNDTNRSEKKDKHPLEAAPSFLCP
jgi:hypothetical protein